MIHSKKLFLKNYSFKEKFIQKNWQLFIQKIIHLEKNGNCSFKKLFNNKKIIQQNIHSKNLKIIHSKKLFIFWKNWLSPRAILTKQSGRPLKLKVVIRCRKKWNEPNLMYIYHLQCEKMQKIQWNSSNGQFHCFHYVR